MKTNFEYFLKRFTWGVRNFYLDLLGVRAPQMFKNR